MDTSETWASPSSPWSHYVSTGAVDLTHCDREQVQFPGAIMPYGVLLILSLSDFRIQGASANTLDWFGSDVEQLLHGHLDKIVAPHIRQVLETSLALITTAQLPRHLGTFPAVQGSQHFDVFAHRTDYVFIVEFEAVPAEHTENGQTGRIADITDSISRLQGAETWQECMAIGVRELKRLTGFDSVVGARFLADGSFHAIAEACEPNFLSVLDKRFPRSDIPEPGRRQMVLMPLQYAQDLDYQPVPLVMAESGHNPLQIDLGVAVLRSSSPMCRRFYKNMGVHSRMVMALLDQGELWGFFSCINATPRTVIRADRLAFKLWAEMAAYLLVEKERGGQLRAALQVKRGITQIATKLAAAEAFPVALAQLPEQLLDQLDVGGAALCLDRHIHRAGVTPEVATIEALMTWLDGQDQAFFMTDRLPALFHASTQALTQTTGLLAARLHKSGQYLFCFRPELVYEVNWAGDPTKQVDIDAESGEERFTPRGSFAVWQQQVRGTARAWQPYETEALTDLQRTLIQLQYADHQQTLQARLARSNAELEAFAYSVSHDLQEPLRGIAHFAEILLDGTGGQQDLNGLTTIQRLAGRMTDQIDALLQYSRAGQQPLALQSVDLNQLVANVLEDLSATIKATASRIEIPRTLPTLACDPIRVTAVIGNLITNAIKYNDSAEKRIEIGYLDKPTLTLFVRDNGIGIPELHHETIFAIFRRLHGRNEYGGGTGAGLTLARRHIEQHGGRLWLESMPGQGCTFYFTLAAGQALATTHEQ